MVENGYVSGFRDSFGGLVSMIMPLEWMDEDGGDTDVGGSARPTFPRLVCRLVSIKRFPLFRSRTKRNRTKKETKRNETKRDGTERRAATPKGNRWPKGQQQHRQQHQQQHQQQQQRQQQRQRRQNKQKQKETSMQRNNKTAKRHGHLPNPHGPARHAKLGKGHSFIPK